MNWGWKITIFLTVFIVFILTLVFMAFGNKIDLVYDDYYQKELDFQEVIDARLNSTEIEKEVNIKHSENGIELTFPNTFNETISKGEISFYRPDNSALDQTKTLDLVNHKQLIDYAGFKTGFYSVFVSFKAGGKDYYIEKSLHF